MTYDNDDAVSLLSLLYSTISLNTRPYRRTTHAVLSKDGICDLHR